MCLSPQTITPTLAPTATTPKVLQRIPTLSHNQTTITTPIQILDTSQIPSTIQILSTSLILGTSPIHDTLLRQTPGTPVILSERTNQMGDHRTRMGAMQ